MAYYSALIVGHKCPICDKNATHEVRGHQNESYGRYCKKHADEKVKRLQERDNRN